MMALEASHTWHIASLPSDRQLIGCKWIFVIKVNLDGTIVQLKAWFVAKGYGQTYGLDYSKTFSQLQKSYLFTCLFLLSPLMASLFTSLMLKMPSYMVI